MFKKIWDQSDIPPDSKTKKRYCVNCKWYHVIDHWPGYVTERHQCANPKFKREPEVSEPDIVTGEVTVRHDPLISCELARKFDQCGESGKLFEPKEETTSQTDH